MKPKKKNKVLEQVKIARKASREEEIKQHGKQIKYIKIAKSKKNDYIYQQIFNHKHSNNQSHENFIDRSCCFFACIQFMQKMLCMYKTEYCHSEWR